MGILNKFIFDGVDSSDYDVLVSGEGVFNSPERDVEVIEVPGRNGAFILDKGRFKNIEVTYPIKNHEANLADFRSKLAGLRNALSSKVGYKRLEDTFHPDEYRMAQFSGPMEVDPIKYNYATDAIDLVFNCKPQRYLKSGETEQTVTSGAGITNPTLFETQPLLLVDGYGKIVINGQEITINSTSIGPVTIAGNWNSPQGQDATYTPNLSALASRDTFYVNVPTFKLWLYGGSIAHDNALNVSSSSSDWVAFGNWGNVQGRDAIYIECTGGDFSFVKSTDSAYTTTLTVTTELLNISVGISLGYSNGNITFGVTTTENYLMQASFQGMEGDSTKSALGSPIYIDCEIGEAYIIDDGEVVSVNNAVVLPADLPKLKPGANTITYNLNVSELKVVSRWWKI